MVDETRPWLVRRRPGPGIDWDFVAYWVLSACVLAAGVLSLNVFAAYFATYPDRLFGDARLYYEATAAWLSGGNPWVTRSAEGIVFAGPPTTLLLNLPLQPFGAEVARVFWAVAGLLGWLCVMRRLRLAPWFLLFPPFLEGYLAGSPDSVLAGLAVLGGGALAAMSKPYSVPALMADRQWRALGVAAVAVVVTLPFLPWGLFLTQLGAVQEAFATQSRNVSAAGNLPLMVAAALALVSLGPRLGLRLAVPALWPGAQLHYSMFSSKAAAASAFLALALSVPGFAAIGIVMYAIFVRVIRPRVTGAGPAGKAGNGRGRGWHVVRDRFARVSRLGSSRTDD